jgi:uncharacterized protein
MLKRNLLCWLLLCFAGVALGQDIPDRPSPPRLVNDFVGNLLSSQQINSLERK